MLNRSSWQTTSWQQPRIGSFSESVAIDEVAVRNGAVHIVRRADGTTNLPKSSGTRNRRAGPSSDCTSQRASDSRSSTATSPRT